MKETKKLDNMLKLFLKTSIFVFMGLLLSKLFSYIYKIIIARYFGPEIYGLFSLSLVIISLLFAISLLGLNEGVIRYISLYRGKKDNEKIKYIFKISSIILIFSAILTAGLSFLFADFIALTIFKEPELSIFLKIFSLMIPFWVFAGFFNSVMNSFEKIKQSVIIEQIIQSFTKVSFLLFFIWLGLKTNAIIFSFFIGIFIFFLTAFFYCKYKLPILFIKEKLNKKQKSKIRNNLFSYSWPTMFFGIIAILFCWIDTLALGFFKSATEVGIYNTAVPIAILLSLTPGLFLQLFFPIITKEYAKKNFKLIKEISKQIGKWIFIINLPFFLLIICFPGAIINLLFGSQYIVASNALRFLSIGIFFSSLFIISKKLILMAGKSKIILIDLIIASIINIFLNILLVPMNPLFGFENTLGINGAAIATLISMIFLNILLMIHARHYTSIIPLRRKMLRIFLISLIPFSLLLILKKLIEINLFSIIILTFLFFASYILLLFLMKGFDRNDIMILSAIKNKLIK